MLDLAIVGGGPAGLTAGLYATRGGLKNVIMFEKGIPGGQIVNSSEIENYPGVAEIKSGMELMEPWPKQAMRFGLVHDMSEVKTISKSGEFFKIVLEDKKEHIAKSVIVCTGSTPKRAGVEGEDEFFGRGVSTCATCDGFFYKGKEVAVLGGGDTALEEASYLSNICSKVYLIHRRDAFRASPATVKRIKNTKNIELVLNSKIQKVYGNELGVEGIITIDKDGKERDLKVPGIFVFVGMNVNNNVIKQNDGSFLCDVNENGEILVDLTMKTSRAGLFAAGDIRVKAPKQVVCAAGDGATAGIGAISYVDSLGD